MINTLTITRPDDWHIHFRDGQAMHSVLPDTARVFGRAIVMPNLKPPVLTVPDALSYRERLLLAAQGSAFQPLMTLYLTDNTTPEQIREAKASGIIHALKYYPAGATTNSDSGVTDLQKAYSAIAAMEEVGLPLLLHGEVVDADIDIFDREAVFIERHLSRLLRDFPKLKMVLEHITTHQAAEFVASAPANVRPHMYCLPVLKREPHRLALIDAVISGNPKFFLGTDSAPHAIGTKENACGCAGIYTAHAAIELYAEAFDDAGALDKLEAFASFHGPDFYGLARNTDRITLQREAWNVPSTQKMGELELVPLRAGESIAWRVL